MKRLFSVALVVIFVLGLTVGVATVGNCFQDDINEVKVNGKHYNLNIIGVSHDKTAEMDCGEDVICNKGHVIFVPLVGNAKIYLSQTPDGMCDMTDGFCNEGFMVLDKNGTDNDGARFMLPDPDPDDDGDSAYSVYVRELGKPGGSATMQTCYIDADGVEQCLASLCDNVLDLARIHGEKPSWRNVSKQLLAVCVDTDGDGVPDTKIGLFDDDTLLYLWDYTNNGLKLAQFRFYPIVTDLGLGDL